MNESERAERAVIALEAIAKELKRTNDAQEERAKKMPDVNSLLKRFTGV